MKKLLISARDPGAAGNISVLYEDLSKTGLFDITLVASGSAYSMIKQKGLKPVFFEISDGKDHVDPSVETTSLLLEKTTGILDAFRPDAVITGLSSFGAGIDEALTCLSDVPVFAVQDFWGDVNLSLGKPADVYLVMDDYAAEITKKRCGARAEVIGSPKYSRYALLDIEGMRRRSREYLGALEDEKVIGWFGQHPDIPGYKAVFGVFLEALVRLGGNHIVFFREHPKFGASAKKNTDFLCSTGIKARDVTGIGNAEGWISACDLLVTPFSLCGLDHSYISAFSPSPVGNVVYLMANHSIRLFFIETSGIEKIPVVEQGLGEWITDSDPVGIAACMEKKLGFNAALAYHTSSNILAGSYNIKKVMAILLESLSGVSCLSKTYLES